MRWEGREPVKYPAKTKTSQMTPNKYVSRSLRFHWRNHLAVFLGTALATAILTGALAVGDSVRFSLKRLALLRLGETEFAIASPSHFFRARLAGDLGRKLTVPTSSLLIARGVVSLPDGSARVNRVQVAGVDDRFWGFSEKRNRWPPPGLVNHALAERLGGRHGQAIVVRVEKPSWLPRDAPLASDRDLSAAARHAVSGIVADEQMGRFSLEANQIPTPTVFVPLSWLQDLVGKPGRANVVLIGRGSRFDAAKAAMRDSWTLDDADLELRQLDGQSGFELRSRRVFLDPPVAEAIQRAFPEARGVLSYFVNELRHGDRTTPYSLVTAMRGGVVPDDMKNDGIVIHSWLAEDLQAKAGDEIDLCYFVVGPQRKLEERTSRFRVRSVVPLEGAAADRGLMPDFPGLHDSENCRDWDAGVPIDFKRIRDKDEKYWDDYRGTPKAFLTLAAGQRIWSNRFGNLTALRFPREEGLEARIRAVIDPDSVGLTVQPVRERALAAVDQSLDFGQLFLGFSLFLIVSALILTGLLFGFGIEQRRQEIGTLRALGFREQRIRRLLLREGMSVAVRGTILGLAGGVAYTKATLWGLTTIWRDAVGGTELRYHAEPHTFWIGALASVFLAGLVIWLAVRRQVKQPVRYLMASSIPEPRAGESRRRARVAGLVGFAALAIALCVLLFGRDDPHAAASFFSAAALLLVAGIAFAHAYLASRTKSTSPAIGIADLATRNAARRRGRSLATVAMLASGTFIVVAVGANRLDSATERGRASGTGGFQWYGETTIPVLRDLNEPVVRDDLGLPVNSTTGIHVVGLRVREGDDASCLNLNRAQTPRILGVPAREFSNAQRFRFLKATGNGDPWKQLEEAQPDGAIPAIADQNTVVWALGKSLGDTIPYTDERGRTIWIRIVGIISNSILQGSLLVSERHFIELFLSESGFRVLLLEDSAANDSQTTRTEWTRALSHFGLELTPSAQRLAEFNAVENSYLRIFGVLGGLGVLLGTAGLGIVVLRNALERRNELAILQAVGFGRRKLRWMIVVENWGLLLMGLLCGTLAGLVAVAPALSRRGLSADDPLSLLVWFGILVSGLALVWFAAKIAVRGPLLKALRNE